MSALPSPSPAAGAAHRSLSPPRDVPTVRCMFPNTQWTEFARATLHGDEAGRAALESLCRNYWEPVRLFIVQRGWPRDEAPDLTQSFFLYVMDKGMLRRAEREKGRFRSFLMGVLNNYLLTERDRRRAQKRGGGHAAEELTDDVSADEEPDAGREFDRQWAVAILKAALQRVAAECLAKRGEGFYECIAVYIGGDGAVLPQEQAAQKAGIDYAEFRQEIRAWRARMRDCLRAEIRRTVSAPHEVEDEMSYLWQLLHPA